MPPLLAHDVFPAAWPGLVLASVVLAAGIGSRLGRPGGLLLAMASVGWLLVNRSMEGGTLVVVVPGQHGLTAADLAGLVGLALAAWLLVRGRV